MTELDLIALGIWWIPVPLPDAGLASVNVWAIEDEDGGIALFDCGHGAPESHAAVANGLAQAGATLEDVRRIVISHAHLEHCGGARRIAKAGSREVAVFASAEDGRALQGALDRAHVLRDGDRLHFRHFAATALALPGHSAGLMGLYADEEGVLFSSDHLVHEVVPGATVECGAEEGALDAVAAYRSSLRRVGGLDVRVVLPGRGPPFAGHRRVVREVLASLDATHPCSVARHDEPCRVRHGEHRGMGARA